MAYALEVKSGNRIGLWPGSTTGLLYQMADLREARWKDGGSRQFVWATGERQVPCELGAFHVKAVDLSAVERNAYADRLDVRARRLEILRHYFTAQRPSIALKTRGNIASNFNV
ncbi:hypothetical protein [Paraburkholderia sp. JHI869]|uniref:hypothetical protein n=1 Tax=Paraburkholderia sp. JHI869 TaxID=3112959 RepID=UPI00317A74F1